MAGPLARSTEDRMIAGVAGGIAAWIGVDAMIVRTAFVALTFVNFIGAIAYVILMIVLPSDTARRPSAMFDPPTVPLGAAGRAGPLGFADPATPTGSRTPTGLRTPTGQVTPTGQPTPTGQRTPPGQRTPTGQRTPPGGQPSGAGTAAIEPARREARARRTIGAGVIVVGSWLLARQLGFVPDLGWSVVGPLVLIGVGALLLAGRSQRGGVQ